MKTSTVMIAVLAVLAVAAVGWVAFQPSEEPEVREDTVNESLNIIGTTDGKVDCFKGIPFAEAPVGDLRFAPPVAKAPWTETLDCREYRDSAVQSPNDSVDGNSEDCLYLNVWAPSGAEPGDKLPVYVWIHGGGFLIGSGNLEKYDGSMFAQQDIIVVTVNYRLGMLGYLNMETLRETYGTAGNFGMLDQMMALEWIQENIISFGGDAGNVTIGGESAGSVSVCNLILCKQAQGLFHKGIMESGTVVNSFLPMVGGSNELSLEMTGRLLADLGLKDDAAGLAALRQMDALTLWALSSMPLQALVDKPYAFMPIYDGDLLPEKPLKAYEEGDYNKDVKVIIGTNAKEGNMFATGMECDNDWEKFAYHTWKGDQARAVIDIYRDSGMAPQDINNELVGMTFFYVPVTMVQNSMAANGSTVYAYEFDYVSSNGMPPLHTAEISYAFGTPFNTVKNPTDMDRRVAAEVHMLWANFMKNGDPNTGDVPPDEVDWIPYNEDSGDVIHFDRETSMGKKTMGDRIDSLIPYYTNI